MVAVFALAGSLASAQPSGQITGTVVDATGAPLVGAVVEVRGPVERSVRTDLDGHFALLGMPGGEYQVVATMDHFAPAVQGLRLVPGASTTVTIALTVAAFAETVVTAAKTGERDVQATPMAVSVLSGDELREAQAHAVGGLAGRAPAVTFSQNSDFGQLTIRGIGTNVVFAGSDPSSAVYVDGVYIARPVMALGDFLDVDRVEVLRGPQGTLYGRNAVGGALNVITRAPTEHLQTSAIVAGGSLDLLRLETGVSGPIVPGRVLGSAAFLRGVRRGFVRDLDHTNHALGSEDVTAGRGSVRFLTNRADLLLSGDATHADPTPLTYAKVLAVKPGYRVDNPPDLHEVRTSALASSRNVQGGGSARLTVHLGPETTLTSLTAYRRLSYDLVNDADITELDLTVVHLRERQHQWSQEVTVAQRRTRVAWVGGLFLFHEADHQPTLVDLPAAAVENQLDPSVEATSRAAYGQATLVVAPRVSAIAGVRFTSEQKTIDNRGQAVPLGPSETASSTGYAYADAISNQAWTPKFGLEYRVREHAMAYASATRGFKSGGFNLSSTAQGRGYAPEWVWSYEAGLKTSLAGGRASLNVAGFEASYTNMQVQTAIRPGVIDISNAASSTIRGVEVETAARLAHAVEFGGHLAWLDAIYDDYVAVGVGGVAGDVAGNRLNNAPAWSGRAWLGWERPVGRRLNLSMRADARWQSTVYFTPFNDAVQQQRPYGLVDLALDVGPAGGCCTVGAFVRNLANTGYITGTFSSPIPAIGGRPGEPRLFGVQFQIRH